MLHNATGKCLGARFILDMVDNDLTAGKAFGLHGIDNLAKHLLFAAGVPNEFNFTRFARRAQNADIELVSNNAGRLRDTSGLRKVFVIAQTKEDLAVLLQAIEVSAGVLKGGIRVARKKIRSILPPAARELTK